MSGASVLQHVCATVCAALNFFWKCLVVNYLQILRLLLYRVTVPGREEYEVIHYSHCLPIAHVSVGLSFAVLANISCMKKLRCRADC